LREFPALSVSPGAFTFASSARDSLKLIKWQTMTRLKKMKKRAVHGLDAAVERKAIMKETRQSKYDLNQYTFIQIYNGIKSHNTQAEP